MLTIQPIRPGQAGEALDLICACFLEFWGDEQDTVADIRRRVEEGQGLDDVAHLEREYFDRGGLFLAGMDDGGRLVATGAITPLRDGVWELRRMWILPEYRRRGVGTRMANRLLEHARCNGAQSVRLHTSSDLEGAVRFYAALGFKHIERYRYTEHSDVFMEKDLAAG